MSSQETKQYCEIIAGSYKAKGYTILVNQKDFNNPEVIAQQDRIDDVVIDISDYIEHNIIFWNVPVNALANLLPENSGARKVLEESKPISFTTTYKFEYWGVSVNGDKMVSLSSKSVPYYLSATYDGKPHQITIYIQPCGIPLHYTSDMKAVRDKFLKSEIRFDITSMKVDDEEYKHFDLMVFTKIAEESE